MAVVTWNQALFESVAVKVTFLPLTPLRVTSAGVDQVNDCDAKDVILLFVLEPSAVISASPFILIITKPRALDG